MTKLYTVLPGVDWVAGQPTPETRQVALTDIEAAFDLSLERIALVPDVPAKADECEVSVLPAIDELMTLGGGSTRTSGPCARVCNSPLREKAKEAPDLP